MQEVIEKLVPSFVIEMTPVHRYDLSVSLFKDSRQEFKVTADTLMVRFSKFRAVLTQKEAASFTERDLELQRKIFELYPKDRSTPLPWL